MRIRENYDPSHIVAADETACWLDAVGETTLEETGAKEVMLRTTGHEKGRLTVLLSARADGSKLKPMVLIPRVRPIKALEVFKDRLHICYTGKSSWMSSELTCEFLTKVLGGDLFKRRTLLCWDSFRAHLTEDVKAYIFYYIISISFGETLRYILLRFYYLNYVIFFIILSIVTSTKAFSRFGCCAGRMHEVCATSRSQLEPAIQSQDF